MSLYDLIAARAGYRCEYCHAPEVLFNHRFPVDHIIPRVFEGSDDMDNLALACHACNGRKYQKRAGMDTTRRRSTRLFNPRQDNMGETFSLESHQDANHRTYRNRPRHDRGLEYE